MSEHNAPVPPSVTAYNHHGCRCDDCKREKRKYHRAYAKRRYLNRGPLLVDATDVRTHLLWLRDNGVGYQRVAQLAGIGLSSMHIWRIANGTTKKVKPSTRNAILAITPEMGCDGSLIDADLTWRRIHGLMALGWPASVLAAELGHRNGRLPAPKQFTTVKKARAVIALVETFGMAIGPDERTRNRALTKGWAPYGAWDDDLRELSDRKVTPTEVRRSA